MSGISEITKKNLNRIENILNDKPEYLRGFVNFMTDSSIQTKYYYLCHSIAFIDYVKKEPNELSFDDFNNYMTKITYKDDGTEMTSSYRINVYSALKKFNEYLYVSKKLKENFMLNIKRPKPKESQKTITKREQGFLTERELKRYLDSIELKTTVNDDSKQWAMRDKAIVYILLTTGIRNTALRMLDIEDINLDKREMIVTDKGGKVKKYELSEKVAYAIDLWLIYRDYIMMHNRECKALFVSNRKKRLSSKTLSSIVERAAYDLSGKNIINGKQISAHKLRATYGTQLYNKTGDIYFVQQCMGHTNPKTTELYIREKKQNTKRASEIMDKFI